MSKLIKGNETLTSPGNEQKIYQQSHPNSVKELVWSLRACLGCWGRRGEYVEVCKGKL